MRLPIFPDLYDPVQRAVLQVFALDPMGVHGLPHWSRVMRNGLLIAREDKDVDIEVVTLFALIHDSMRDNEFDDPMHGIRAARFALELYEHGKMPWLREDKLTYLRGACADHEKGLVTHVPTIQACWDADRLDLPRVGIMPDPKLLGSKYALMPGVIEKHWEEAWNAEGMEAMIEP